MPTFLPGILLRILRTMKRRALQTSATLALLCASALLAQVQRKSPEISPGETDAKAEHVSFVTEDGANIYADLYGQGDRGVVLAHGG